VLAGTGLLAACGSSGSASPTTAAAASQSAGGPTTTSSRQAALQAYTNCLKDHGMTVPAGGFGGFGRGGPGGTDDAGSAPTPSTPRTTLSPAQQQAFTAARQACQSLLPAGGFGGGGGARNTAAFQAYLSCLKDHGVTIPTTTTAAPGSATSTGGRGGFGGGLGGINRNDPTFIAANKVCQALLPTPGGSTTTTAPTNG
jgi:hypothetical protein